MKRFLIKTLSILLVILMLFGFAAPATFAIETSKLTGLSNTYHGVRVAYQKVDSADSYNFYRKTAETDWQLIGSKNNDKLSYFVDEDVESGVYYTYYMATVIGGNEIKDTTEYSIYFLDIPEFTLSTKDSSVVVDFESVVGADRYQILRKDKANPNFKEIGVSTTNTYTDATVEPNVEYTYAVRAYEQKSCSYIYSKSIFAYPTPTMSNVNGGVKVSYQKVDNATRYNLYRKSDGGDWGKIGTMKASTWFYFVDKTAVSGEFYNYAVEVETTDGIIAHDEVGARFLYLEDPTIFLSTDGNSVTIDFTYTPGAERYQILRKTGSASFKAIGWVDAEDSLSFKDTNVIEGETYTYAVRAYSGNYCSYINSKSIDVALFTEDSIFEETISTDLANEIIEFAEGSPAFEGLVVTISTIPEVVNTITTSEPITIESTTETTVEPTEPIAPTVVPATKIEFSLISLIKGILISILNYCISIIAKI